MASKKGRETQSWVSTPIGCFLKALLHMITAEKRALGLRGSLLRDEVVAKFNRLVPYHNEYWSRPRTRGSIWGRGMTTTKSHHAVRENAYENKHTAPYCALAGRLMELNAPWPKEELDRRVAEVASILAAKAAPRRIEVKQVVKDTHREFLRAKGDRCPHCLLVAEVFQCDHFYTNQKPDLAHTWSLCVPCHNQFTYGRRDRDEAASIIFHAYQVQLKKWIKNQKEAAE